MVRCSFIVLAQTLCPVRRSLAWKYKTPWSNFARPGGWFPSLICHVLAIVTPVVVVVTAMIMSIVAIMVITIRVRLIRVVARLSAVRVVGKQWFRPGVAIQAVEPICQRVVWARGPVVILVVPAVVNRIIVPVVVVAGCVIVT